MIFTVALVTFFLMYRAPGGPWDQEKPVPESARRMLNARFHLDDPLWINGGKFSNEWDSGTRNPLPLAGARAR